MFLSDKSSLQKYIYVFALSKKKFFLYSSFEKDDQEQIQLEAELYYDYLKKYKILKTIQKITQKTPFDLDYYVKQYMYFYGFANVRGGSYIEEELPEWQEKVLNEELDTVSNDEQKPREYILHVILEEYKSKTFSREEVKMERERIIQRREQYKLEKSRLCKIKNDFIYSFENQIEWLKRQYIQKDDGTLLRNTKYKQLIETVKKVYCLYIQEFEKPDENDIYFKYPEFIFDSYMYDSILPRSMELINKICSRLVYFTNCIINRIQEYEFDISSYGLEDEWVFSRKLYLLDLALIR